MELKYSPYCSQSHGRPDMIASRGMSSTVSIMEAKNSRSCGLQGANVTPQLPISAVVTPCQLTGVMSGSQPICASRWVCVSINPGVTIWPVASMTSFASPSTWPIAAITPSLIAKSPSTGSAPVPSTKDPPRIIMSYILPPPACTRFSSCAEYVTKKHCLRVFADR